jgi:hypothetical protein
VGAAISFELLPRWCGSAADSWYDISEELSFANAAIHSAKYFSRGDPVCYRDFLALACLRQAIFLR